MFDKLTALKEAVASDFYMCDGAVVMRAVRMFDAGVDVPTVAKKINAFMACLTRRPGDCVCDDPAHITHSARMQELYALASAGDPQGAAARAMEFVSHPDYSQPENVEMSISMASLAAILNSKSNADMQHKLAEILMQGARLLRAESPALRRINLTLRETF